MPVAFIYTHSEPEPAFDAETISEGEFGIVVFQHQDGSLGFDDDTATEFLNALLGEAMLVERAPEPRWQAGGAGTSRIFLRRHLGRGIFALVRPSERVHQELSALESATKQRRANEVRLRLGREPLPQPASVFDHWLSEEGKLEGVAFSFFCDNSALIAEWKHSDWGAYCVAYSRRPDEILAWVAAAATPGIDVRLVSSRRQLPSW